MGEERIFTRRRGFTLLTVLLAGVDVAAIAGAAALWYAADAERHGENMPWLFGALVVAAFLGLVMWARSAGRNRSALVTSTLLVIAAALTTLFG